MVDATLLLADDRSYLQARQDTEGWIALFWPTEACVRCLITTSFAANKKRRSAPCSMMTEKQEWHSQTFSLILT